MNLQVLVGRCRVPLLQVVRKLSMANARKGLILGIYEDPSNKLNYSDAQLTSNAKAFNDAHGGKLISLLNCAEPLAAGKCRLFYGLDEKFSAVAVATIGKRGEALCVSEQLHQGKESLRSGVGAAAVALRDAGIREIHVDPAGYPEAAAESAELSLFCYDELKSDVDARKPKVNVLPFCNDSGQNAQITGLWERGVILASSQNIVRRLSDMPANILTPTRFADEAKQLLHGLESVEVICHDKAWAEQQKMGAFLSVAQGSDQPPMFVEIHLKPSQKPSTGPVVLVGKGVCFDSGGISLKPSHQMDEMRGDMAGAAMVLATVYGLAKLKTPLNREVIALMPLVENLPSGKATKPGDIVFARNKKSIKIDNTDAEGRLILADALCYADDFSPSHVLDMATLTGAIRVSLGGAAAGVFTNNEELWNQLLKGSIDTGDRVWRLPLFQYFSSALKTCSADLDNISKPAMSMMGGSSVAAVFLKEFTKCQSWAHIDVAGVAMGYSELTYLPSGMTGRPTRTIISCVESLCK